MILIAVAMVAFNQDWHVEEERPIGDEIPPGDEPDEDEAARHAASSPAAHRTSRSVAQHRDARPRKA